MVIIFSSKYEERISIPTCSHPAKQSPVPTEAFSSIYFSCSVSLNTFCSTSIEAGDCLRSSCMEEFVTIALPYEDHIKSSTSCVIVVTPSPYLRARLTSPKRNFAESSYCMIFHASSTTRNRFFSLDLATFQTYVSSMYMAIGRRISSRSRTENTTSHHLRSTLVGFENTPENTQNTYFSRRFTRPFAPSIVSRTEWRSLRSGISFHSIESSSIVIHLSE